MTLERAGELAACVQTLAPFGSELLCVLTWIVIVILTYVPLI